jgi:hypothetical protein
MGIKIWRVAAILVLVPGSAVSQTIEAVGRQGAPRSGLERLSVPPSDAPNAISTGDHRLSCAASALPAFKRVDALRRRLASSDNSPPATGDGRSQSSAPKRDLSYLAYYAYAELPPDEKPADLVLASIKNVPLGTPVQEIKRAAEVFGIDFHFMQTVAKIESDFDPKQRTGSYIGLFQLSRHEFQKYGSGEITSPRDNAIAAAYKFATESVLFELEAHRNPTFSELYLIHQQGWEGASEHVGHPERIAWQSMCATDEGREKGQRWCKLAIWGNTPASVKRVWRSVDKLTSEGFVSYWRTRVDELYRRYSGADIDVATTATVEAAPNPRATHTIRRGGVNRGRRLTSSPSTRVVVQGPPPQQARGVVGSITDLAKTTPERHRTSKAASKARMVSR